MSLDGSTEFEFEEPESSKIVPKNESISKKQPTVEIIPEVKNVRVVYD